MIQTRTQDEDLLFAQEPVKTAIEKRSPKSVPRRSGGLNRIKPKTGKAAEKRRRRLERIRNDMLAEKAEVAEEPAAVADTAVASDAAAVQSVGHPSPRFSEADLKPRQSRRRVAATPKSEAPPSNRDVLATFATFAAAAKAQKPTSTPKSTPKPKLNKSDSPDSDVAGNYRVIDPPPPEPETYPEWFKRVVVNHRWTTWFTTFYVHWLLLLLLAAIIVHGPENAASLLIDATFAEAVEQEIPSFEVVTTEPEPQPESEPESVPESEPEIVEMEEEKLELNPDLVSELATERPPETSSDSASTSQNEAAQQATSSSAIDAYNPAPASAVSEGSFSVWTEPAMPKAGEPYRIVIQVRLPASIRRYELSDLQGVVVGSDGYRKPIPGSMQGALPIDNGYARFVVPIVSADATVRDTVFIRSRLLKETQKLVLQF